MCQSFFEGNRKCAEHTQPPFEKALTDYQNARDHFDRNLSTAENVKRAETSLAVLAEYARLFASTHEGEPRLIEVVAQAEVTDDDWALAHALLHVIREGRQTRAAEAARAMSE